MMDSQIKTTNSDSDITAVDSSAFLILPMRQRSREPDHLQPQTELEPGEIPVHPSSSHGNGPNEALEEQLSRYFVRGNDGHCRCKIPDQECAKLFNSEYFWRMHVERRHSEWLSRLRDKVNAVDSGEQLVEKTPTMGLGESDTKMDSIDTSPSTTLRAELATTTYHQPSPPRTFASCLPRPTAYLLLLGGPCAGKLTQSQFLVQEHSQIFRLIRWDRLTAKPPAAHGGVAIAANDVGMGEKCELLNLCLNGLDGEGKRRVMILHGFNETPTDIKQFESHYGAPVLVLHLHLDAAFNDARLARQLHGDGTQMLKRWKPWNHYGREMLDYYREKGILVEVDARGGSVEVLRRVEDGVLPRVREWKQQEEGRVRVEREGMRTQGERGFYGVFH